MLQSNVVQPKTRCCTLMCVDQSLYFNHQKALLRKKIKTALKEQIEARDDLPEEDKEKDNSPEIVQKFINSTPSQTSSSSQPPASTTPPSDASDVQEKETKKKKPRRAKDR